MSECALLFIQALTSLHPGSGTALGVVDLPVQRERHSGWPTIPGSSLKGVLRELSRRQTGKPAKEADADEELCAVFGPPTANAPDHAGALGLTDARLLAYPVRSLCGVFAWITCPLALLRLGRDRKLLGQDPPSLVPGLKPGQALCPAGSPLLPTGMDKLLLEELEFERVDDTADGQLGQWLGPKLANDRLQTHLAVLHDDDFGHFVRHATEIVARVGLDYDRKTVKNGALFYEEFLPAETIFYSVAVAEDSRRESLPGLRAGGVLTYLGQRLAKEKVIQVGAGETIGKGLCEATLWPGKEA